MDHWHPPQVVQEIGLLTVESQLRHRILGKAGKDRQYNKAVIRTLKQGVSWAKTILSFKDEATKSSFEPRIALTGTSRQWATVARGSMQTFSK